MSKTLIGARSTYSLGESILTIDQLVEYASAQSYDGIELADTMTLSGVTEFVNACFAKKIRPIVGVRLRVVPNASEKGTKTRNDPPGTFYPKVYPKTPEARQRLFELMSRAHSPEFFYYVPRIGYEQFKELVEPNDFVIRTGDMHSIVALNDSALLRSMLGAVNAENIFFDIVPINTPYWDRVNELVFRLREHEDAPLLVSYPKFYKSLDLADSRDVMATVLFNQKMSSPTRHINYIRDFALESDVSLQDRSDQLTVRLGLPLELPREALFGALDASEVFAAAVPLTWEKMPVSLPKTVSGNELEALIEQCKEGWPRLLSPVMGYQPNVIHLADYKDRLRYELSVIKKMGFERYFLVVADLVRWSKKNGIIVGPGRGSVGGSLVAFLLGITDVDPIRFGLLFERFINPERIDLPDADLDFQSDRREEVIKYLIEKYGEDNVAGISNVVQLQAASAIRDVGRVFDLLPHEVSCSKLVPKEHGMSSTLPEAAEQVPAIDAFRLKYPEIWKHAVNLEGTVRNYGRHAAGIIVAGEPIVHRAVVETHKNDRAVNWDKVDVEHWGLVKIDVLGLSTLQVIKIALDHIEKQTGTRPNLLTQPLDDLKVLEAFGKGKTTGVFQFESPGMKSLLRDLAFERSLTFDDLVAATALYRPGPKDSGLLDDYVAIKQGLRAPYYEHPALEAALKSTDGVMIYQEGVMEVFKLLAGFTMAEADNARKAMGKKDKEKMEKLRVKFVEGAEKHSGFERERGEALFDKIMNFAAYGFNKSHAVEYSVISYWTMWLKVYHPAAFFAATLTVLDEDKLQGLVRDAREHGLEILPPDINLSTDVFEVVGNDLLAPFHRIKGLSIATSELILSIRGTTPFKDHNDFKARMPTKLNSRQRSALDKVGSLAILKGDPKGARHPDRRKDQMELMPGLIIDNVRSARPDIPVSAVKDILIRDVLKPALRGCENCSLKGGVHPVPRLGKRAKFMVVSDCPHWGEEAAAQMLEGKPSEALRAALKNAELSIADGYFTALVKSPKADKVLTNEQINGCKPWLEKEIEILKPPVIVALGSLAARHFVPDLGNADDSIGRVVYDPKLDANIVIGFSPLRIHFDPSKQTQLEEVFAQVAELID